MRIAAERQSVGEAMVGRPSNVASRIPGFGGHGQLASLWQEWVVGDFRLTATDRVWIDDVRIGPG